VRTRILGVAVLTAVLAVALFGSALAWSVHRLYYADERGELERLALLGALAVPAGIGTSADPVELPATEQSVRLGIYDRSGRRLAGEGPATADAATDGALAGHVTDTSADEIVVAVPVISDENVVAAARASSARSVVQHRLYRTWAGMFGLAVIAGACASVLAAMQARRLARPLHGLADVAQELGGGNFAARARDSGVDDIDRAGHALNQTAERLADMITRERAFTTHASHQLRTPLTSLRLCLESALKTPGADLRQATAEAIVHSDRLSSTIDDVLNLARGAAGELESMDLDTVLNDLPGRWQAGFAAQGRSLDVQQQATPPARASAPAVRQILDVLIDNALRHGRGTVTVLCRPSTDGAIAIDVTDEGTTGGVALLSAGPGTTPVPVEAGHFGLALAASLAEAQGGRLLHARTEPTTRVSLLLPAVADGRIRPQ
jgi:signal transduction histidine kinase